MILIYFLKALSYATFGPAYVDLKYTLNTSMKWISLFSALFSAGNILGTFCEAIVFYFKL